MNSQTLEHKDRHALQSLRQKLYLNFPGQIQEMILFGSKARGDDRPDSDIDVLVIVKDETWPVKSAILRVGARLSLEYDLLFNLVVISEERWQRMEQIKYPLFLQVVQDGLAFDQLPLGE